MFRLNCCHHGSNTYTVKTYKNKVGLQCLRISNKSAYCVAVSFSNIFVSSLMTVVKPKHVGAN